MSEGSDRSETLFSQKVILGIGRIDTQLGSFPRQKKF
jgi:hypothetical protein